MCNPENFADNTIRQQTEVVLHESDAGYEIIFNAVKTGILIIDPETHRIADANPVALEVIGAPRDRVVGAACHRFICPADRGRCPVTDLGQVVDDSERILLTAAGENRNIIKTVRPVVLNGRKMLLETFVDITARKQAEEELRESEDRYRDLVENSFLLIGTHDAQGRFLSLNRAAARLLEIASADGLEGLSLTEYIPSDLLPKLDEYLETVLRTGHAEGLMVILTPSGKTKIVEYENTLRVQDSNDPIVRWTGREVTENIKAEKAQGFLASLVESSQDAIIGKTLEGMIVSWNHGAEELYGYSTAEAIGKPVSMLAPPDRRDEWEPITKKICIGERVSGFETVRVRMDGRLVDVALTISPVRDTTGKITGVATIARDISERKRTEEELSFKTALLAAESETTIDGILVVDPAGHVIQTNKRFGEMWNLPEDILNTRDDGKMIEKVLGQLKDPDVFLEKVSFLYSHEGEKLRDEIEFKDGRFFERYSSPLRGSTGTYFGRIYYFRDITERKQAEQRARLQTVALESAANGIFIVNREGHIIWANPAFTRLTGYSAIEVLGHNPRILKSGQQDRAFYQRLWNTILFGDVWTGEITNRRKDGTLYTEEMTVTPVRDALGAITHFIAIKQDITERKRDEEELFRSRQMLQSILDTIPQRVFWKDRNLIYLGCNQAFAQDAGVESPREIIGKNDFELSWKEDAELYRADDRLVIEGNSPKLGFEESLSRPDGSRLWILTNKLPLCNREGSVSGVLGTFEDITARKEAEQALEERTAFINALIEMSPMGIVAVDGTGRIEMTNPAFERLFQYPRQETLGLNLDDVVAPPDLLSEAIRLSSQCRSGTEIHTTSLRRRKDGTLVEVDIYAVPLVVNGQPRGSMTLYQDISERKRAEKELRESEKRYRLLFENNLAGVIRTTTDGRVLDCNQALARMAGYDSPQEILARQVLDFYYTPQDRAVFLERLKTEGCVTNFEMRLRSKDGSPVWMIVNVALSAPSAESSQLIEGTLIDITERKQAEEKVRESNELVRLLLDSIPEAVYGIDAHGDCTFSNPSCLQILGYEADADLHDKNMHALVHHTRQDGTPYPVEECHIYEAFRGGVGTHIDGEVMWRRDGTSFPAEYWSHPIYRDENVIGSVVTFIDITERKRAEAALQESEQQYRLLFSQMVVGFALLEAIRDERGVPIDFRYIEINFAFEKHTGLARGQVIGRTIREVLPGIESSWVEMYGRVANTGESIYFEDYAQPFDKWFEGTAFRVRPGQTAVTFADVTERKKAEDEIVRRTQDLEIAKAAQEKHAAELANLVEELAQERDLLGTVMDNLPDSIFYKDRQSRFLRTNPAHARTLGLEQPSQTLGRTDFDFFPAEDARVHFDAEQQVIETGQPLIGHTERLRRPDGEYCWYFTSRVPIRDKQGHVIGVVGIGRDITERMQAEEKLRDSEAKYRSLVSNIPDIIWTLDSRMQIAFISPNIEKMSGVSQEEHYRRGAGLYMEAIHPDDLGRVKQGIEGLFARGEPYDVECRVRGRDGDWIWVHDRAVATYEKNGVRYADGLLTDITPSKRAEETLRASEERYRELFENASDMVYTADLDGRLTSLNRVAEQTLGYSRDEALELNFGRLMDEKNFTRFESAIEQMYIGGSTPNLEIEITAKDGRRVMLEIKPRLIYKDGKITGLQGIARDITGRNVAEMELRHAQKLESVGRLAAGIAHEINTPIQFVGDNTRFLQDSFGALNTLLGKYQELRGAAEAGSFNPELLGEVRAAEEKADYAYLVEEVPKALSETLEGVTRVATIVRAMKEFAHPEGKEMAAADLNRAILSTLTVARNELKYVADVETDFGNLPLVVCNIGDLNQVFLNLLVNAAHAIGEVAKDSGKKGKIRVRTNADGATVLVAISDTGGGIPEAIRNRIFDPFFTTKEVGRGTGQGLAIARSVVVDRHKGTLTFESEMGKGTTFYIRLPFESGDGSEL